MDKEVLKLKVENFISLRASIINILIVLIGGVVSLAFVPNSIPKGILICFGFFYIFTFSSNLINIMRSIDKLLNERRFIQ